MAPLWIVAVLAGFSLQSCSDDDDFTAVDNKQPVVDMAGHFQVEAGSTFTLTGTITDADGIRSITLQNSEMYLDKTINLLEIYGDSLITTYNLSYSYDAPSTWTPDMQLTVRVVVEDVVGNVTETSVLVTPDGDFTAPVFMSAPSGTVTVLSQNPVYTLNCTVSDNKALKYVKVEIPDLGISDSISTGSTAQYSFTRRYDIPDEIGLSYAMRLTVGDEFDNVTTTESVLTVSEMPDFAKMYLVDFTDASRMTSDLFGIPMLIEHTGEYQYVAHYYNSAAGTGVRFVPQKTDFYPICFGVDPTNEAVLTSDPSQAQPIVLDEVAYYEITFNSVTGEYSVQTYTPTDEPFPQGQMFTENGIEQPYELSLAGAGLPGVGNWNTADPYLLTQDANNPYLFYAEMDLTAGTSIEFTITPKSASGWWPEPFWRFEKPDENAGETNSGENEYNTPNDGNNMTPVTVQTSGKYRFEFDTHLCRSKFYPIN